MANGPDMNMVLTVFLVILMFFIFYMVARIVIKTRKGPKPKKKKKKGKVLQAVSEEPDAIFNSIVSTKRISSDLKVRGISTDRAEELLGEARIDYDSGREDAARFKVKEAKDILLRSKSEWDEKTGFDVVTATTSSRSKGGGYRPTVDLVAEDQEVAKPDEVFPELKKAVDKKPDNYLPSKFTISLAERAIESAEQSGLDTSEARSYLLEAKACYVREDYDEAFKDALNCRRAAEAVLGLATKMEGGGEMISDLAMLPTEGEEPSICSMCGDRKIAYISIETDDGVEATCRECYEKSMGKVLGVTTQADIEQALKPREPEGEDKAEPEKEEDRVEEEEKQHFCPNCGAKIKGVDVFCGKCGKPVTEELKCVGCGEKVEPGDMFCRKCGARLVT
jgi:Zn finger protein HypA/HybF involved in hydrogenase expression